MQSNPAQHPTILLVTGDDLLRRSLARRLSQLGHPVVVARDAQGARLAWEQSHSAVDLLLTDVLLPGMGGPVLARKLTTRSPRLGVIFLSAHRGEVLIAQGVLPPNALCLSKRHPTELLAGAVHRALVPPKERLQVA